MSVRWMRSDMTRWMPLVLRCAGSSGHTAADEDDDEEASDAAGPKVTYSGCAGSQRCSAICASATAAPWRTRASFESRSPRMKSRAWRWMFPQRWDSSSAPSSAPSAW